MVELDPSRATVEIGVTGVAWAICTINSDATVAGRNVSNMRFRKERPLFLLVGYLVEHTPRIVGLT
jgi:hypothetical protein